jgi:site-specific DNA-methyltransferase (adenine-specific)
MGGDMLELNKIYNMDCLEGMRGIQDKSIDIVLTSPPYNFQKNASDRGYDLYNDLMTNEEYSLWICDIFNEFDRILKNNGKIIWNASYSTSNTDALYITIGRIIERTNFSHADTFCWKKLCAYPDTMSPNRATRIVEFVYIFARKNELRTFTTNKTVIDGINRYVPFDNFISARNNDGPTHGLNFATFSSEMCHKMLNIYSSEKDKDVVVLDPFMGTGTTAVACVQKGFNYIGFEISKAQVEYAIERIDAEKAQMTFFD